MIERLGIAEMRKSANRMNFGDVCSREYWFISSESYIWLVWFSFLALFVIHLNVYFVLRKFCLTRSLNFELFNFGAVLFLGTHLPESSVTYSWSSTPLLPSCFPLSCTVRINFTCKTLSLLSLGKDCAIRQSMFESHSNKGPTIHLVMANFCIDVPHSNFWCS